MGTSQVLDSVSIVSVFPLSDARATLETVGGKGTSLAQLSRAGLPVPGGFHVTTAAYRRFVAENHLQPVILAALQSVDAAQLAILDAASHAIQTAFTAAPMPAEIIASIGEAYARLPGADPAVAVRSSATAEDLPELSFAGQQETFLNVRGVTAVQDVVKRCWASLWTARAIGYRAQHHVDPPSLSLAVVVQLLVPAEAAGIMFTANPLNGQRDQLVINAAWGLGEAIVGGLVTPDTLMVDKQTGRVLTRETADKQLMTVRTESGTMERAVPEAKRHAPVLDDRAAAALVRLGIQVEQLYRRPMDIEWTWADGAFNLVQARPITALAEPEASVPTEWPLPDPKGRYMRASIVELLPDPLTPLFATLGRAAINRGGRRAAAQVLGVADAWPAEMIVTINDYAYYGIRFTARQMWVLFSKIPFIAPRLLRTAEQRWRDDARPRYVASVERWRAQPLNALAASDILRGVREMLDDAIYHYVTLQAGIIPAAYISEALFTDLYHRLIKRHDDPPALTYLLGFDSTPILAEKSLYDLAVWCRAHPRLAAYLSTTPAKQLAAELARDTERPNVDPDDGREWQRRFRAHLEKFGHTIYDLDFAKPVPADAPAPLLETIKFFIGGESVNPHARQQKAAGEREQATQAMLTKLKGVRQRIFRRLVRWAQQYAPLREDGLADVGLGWPLLRQMLWELGRRLRLAGMIEQASDIFWLSEAELEQTAAALDGGSTSLPSAAETIRQRKATWKAEQQVTPPPVLPPRVKWMGFDLQRWMPARAEQSGDLIKGIGASPGTVTATARVLRGPDEFGQMRPGDVLVAAITTPAWTPLFALASGVVTDVGGPLSHSSIVAREYGIPAVLGTGVATKRIHSDQTITVDGSAGMVTLARGSPANH